MSFTNGKSFKLSDYNPKYKWSCGLCGYIFKDNDILRWINNINGSFIGYNGKQWGASNIFVCEKCDCSNEQIGEKYRVLMTKYEFLWNENYGE